MPILKKSDDSRPYDTIDRETAQSITDPSVLGVWVYLLTKPQGWIVRATEVQDHFSMGSYLYKRIMREMKGLGLCWTETERSDGGQITTRYLTVSYLPNIEMAEKFNHKSDFPTVGKIGHALGRENHVSENLTEGKPTHLETRDFYKPQTLTETEILKEKTSKKKVDPETPETAEAAPCGGKKKPGGGKKKPPKKKISSPAEPLPELPEGVCMEAWQDFVEHRAQPEIQRKSKFTPLAAKKAATFLARHTETQQQQIVDASIMGGWPGLFPSKAKTKNDELEEARRQFFANAKNSVNGAETVSDFWG